MKRKRSIVAAMGAYYVATGAWPLLHMSSFEAVTGRKTDRWLVHMVGALAIANGLALSAGIARRDPGSETYALALGSITAFSAIDIIYAVRRTIAPIYLGDAVMQLIFGAALCIGSRSKK